MENLCLIIVCLFYCFDFVRNNRFIFDNNDSSSDNSNNHNNHSHSNNSHMTNGLSALFLFSNNCFYQASIIDGLYTSYTLYASYGSILMVFSSAATLFSANFDIIYQNTHCRCDLISIFDDTSVFSIVFDTMIIIVTRIIQFGNV